MDTALGAEVNTRSQQRMTQGKSVEKAGQPTNPDEPVRKSKKSGHIAAAAQGVSLNSVTHTKGVEQKNSMQDQATTPHRPTQDSFIRENADNRESFGYYKQVPDGHGSTTIHFEQPTDNKSDYESLNARNQTGSKQNSQENRKSGAAIAAEKTGAIKTQEKQQKSAQVKALEERKAYLEKRIQSCTKIEAKRELEKQLKQIKQKLRALK